ncbi:MAG TPA: hypothetical protein VKS79_26235 [Gemmataceae bacterium]|nr:hypothetical protein [Gemmataceae bacterium]
MHEYTCPECNTVLRRQEPIPAGKKIKCPKCSAVFAPAADAVAKAAAKPTASPKDAKAKALEDEFMDRNPYGVVDETEEDEELQREKQRAASGLVRDRFKKSARGPAQREVVRPANFLLASGVFTCIFAFLTIVVAIWPLIFRELTIDKPQEGVKYSESEKDKKPEYTYSTEYMIFRFSIAGVGLFWFIWGAFVCVGAFKMNRLESYTWAMIGSIMGILPVLIGIWGIVTLRNPVVIAGFREEKVPEA